MLWSAADDAIGGCVEEQGQHVVPVGDRWAVRKGGSDRATAIFDTQREAIARGREIAKNQGVELCVHRRDGTIRSKSSYGEDPNPPKG